MMKCFRFALAAFTIAQLGTESPRSGMAVEAATNYKYQSGIAPFEFLRNLLFAAKKNENDEAKLPQPLLVLGAGLPRTGTSSFVAAMKRLVLKSYHMKEGVIQTPGHFDLWVKHARQTLSGANQEAIEPSETIDSIIKAMSADGFNATNDYPTSLIFRELLQAYPDAKVVLTVRTDGHAWAASVLNSIAVLYETTLKPPFGWIARVQDFHRLYQFLSLTGFDHDARPPNPPSPSADHFASVYDRWVQHVKETVPEDQLLVFSAKDGWEPLCAFLSPIDESIASACEKMIQSGEAYPHVNENASVQRVLLLMKTVTELTRLFPLLLSLLLFRLSYGSSASAKKEKKS